MSDPQVPVLEAEALLDVRMRLSAELGRARMPVAKAVALGGGTIVDLDRAHDDPVEVYVNGLHFGTGRLLLVDGEWALRLEHLDSDDQDAARRGLAALAPEAAGEPFEQPSSDDQAAPGGTE